MDPNANLQEQERIIVHPTVQDRAYAQAMRTRLSELRVALREWLQAGGFAPDWSKAPRAAKYYGQTAGGTQ